MTIQEKLRALCAEHAPRMQFSEAFFVEAERDLIAQHSKEAVMNRVNEITGPWFGTDITFALDD